jgi:hypothetical protein
MLECGTLQKTTHKVYLKYVAPDDIHIYSIDEVFIVATHYLGSFHISAHDFVMQIILDVLKTTDITATAGIGPNLYLAKVAMDVWAKHVPADENGVRIAELDEMSYREKLWNHRPLTDFWRVGAGYTKKLEAMGLYTMDDIARCSLGKPTDFYNEDTLYDVFGVNAEPIARELHENGIFWFSLSSPSLSTGFAPVELFTKSRTTQNMCVNGNEDCAEIEKLTTILIKKGLYMTIEEFVYTAEETGATPFSP